MCVCVRVGVWAGVRTVRKDELCGRAIYSLLTRSEYGRKESAAICRKRKREELDRGQKKVPKLFLFYDSSNMDSQFIQKSDINLVDGQEMK